MQKNFDQVDSIGYILHAWMKYPKFGHACASDYAARFVRYGLLSRKEAIELVQKEIISLTIDALKIFVIS